LSVKKIDHIGIAVRSIVESRPFYEQALGARFEGIEEVAAQQVRVAFFQVGEVRLELLEATSESSPVARLIARRGEGLHHIAYEVEDLAGRLARLAEQGVRLIDEQPRPGAHGTEIAFLHPQSTGGVLTELCQPKKA
jgi:methylmalonyl-CoA/ethylmalonyl-CoA epimerase